MFPHTSSQQSLLKCFQMKIAFRNLGPIHNHFFVVTYEWDQFIRVLHYTRLERFVRGKHSRLMSPSVSYKEN
jgi:hypothetical protein